MDMGLDGLQELVMEDCLASVQGFEELDTTERLNWTELKQFSKEAVSLYTPLSSVWELHFYHTLGNNWCCQSLDLAILVGVM